MHASVCARERERNGGKEKANVAKMLKTGESMLKKKPTWVFNILSTFL